MPQSTEATLPRRAVVPALAAAFTGLAAAARAQPRPAAPPSTVTAPPRDFGPGGAPTTYFSDPDVLVVDPSFQPYVQPNSAIQRLWTGALWAEGPAWCAQGRYLLWSDIPNNRQMRWLQDDGHVSVFRAPSNNSNGEPSANPIMLALPIQLRARDESGDERNAVLTRPANANSAMTPAQNPEIRDHFPCPAG